MDRVQRVAELANLQVNTSNLNFGDLFSDLEEIRVTGYGTVPIAPRDVVARAMVQATWRLVPR